MKRILRGQAKAYAFDRSLPPKLRVNPGEKFILETEDAASGYLREEGQSPLNRPFIDETWPPSANPVAGPKLPAPLPSRTQTRFPKWKQWPWIVFRI